MGYNIISHIREWKIFDLHIHHFMCENGQSQLQLLGISHLSHLPTSHLSLTLANSVSTLAPAQENSQSSWP